MRTVSVLVFSMLCGSALAEPASGRFENPDPIPDGQLGFPIGVYLVIEGVRAETAKAGAQTLVVHRVNGKRPTRKTTIWIDNLQLPADERCIIKGYESARWVGIPPQVIEAGAVRVSPSSHPPWHLSRYFIATSVESPKSLELKHKP